MDVDEMMPAWQLSDGELTAALLAVQQDLNRTYARMLDLVGDFDKRGLAVEKGSRGTAAFMVHTLRVSSKEAKARVAQANADLPMMRKSLESGDINREHAHETSMSSLKRLTRSLMKTSRLLRPVWSSCRSRRLRR